MQRPQPRRAVVAEPDDALRDSLVASLAAWGVDARGAHAAHAAVRVARAHRPDLWIVDDDLPGLTATEFVRAVRAVPAPAARPLVVAISADPGAEAGLRAAGADAFLVKPFGDRALGEAIAAALRAAREGEPAAR